MASKDESKAPPGGAERKAPAAPENAPAPAKSTVVEDPGKAPEPVHPPDPAATEPVPPARPPIDGAAPDLGGRPVQAPEPAPVKVVHPYQVPPGKALVTKRGVLGPGDGVSPLDVAESVEKGIEQLDHLAAHNLLLKQDEAVKGTLTARVVSSSEPKG
jgi:hypothetical protein